MIRRITMLAVAALLVVAFSAPMALAAQSLDPGCVKITGSNADLYPDSSGPGTVYCQTVDLPGKSDNNTQGTPPVTTVTDETQGNSTNKQPAEQQGLANNECEGLSPGLCKQATR
jgi:hypothetical protein